MARLEKKSELWRCSPSAQTPVASESMSTSTSSSRAIGETKSTRDKPKATDGAKAAGATITKRPYHYRKKKPAGMPKRPLSAYNYFFRDQRELYLAKRSNNGSEPMEDDFAVGADSSAKNFERLDPKPNLFSDMGKSIGKEWKQLPAEKKRGYEELAAADMRRYKSELEGYHRSKESGTKRSQNGLVSDTSRGEESVLSPILSELSPSQILAVPSSAAAPGARENTVENPVLPHLLDGSSSLPPSSLHSSLLNRSLQSLGAPCNPSFTPSSFGTSILSGGLSSGGSLSVHPTREDDKADAGRGLFTPFQCASIAPNFMRQNFGTHTQASTFFSYQAQVDDFYRRQRLMWQLEHEQQHLQALKLQWLNAAQGHLHSASIPLVNSLQLSQPVPMVRVHCDRLGDQASVVDLNDERWLLHLLSQSPLDSQFLVSSSIQALELASRASLPAIRTRENIPSCEAENSLEERSDVATVSVASV
jgi:HMG (high mobility group) box